LKACLLLAFATLGLAANLPKSVGYVNDFAGRLSPSERQALEYKLRDYERATSNEVAIAIVESLDGEPVDAYANRLFKAWGIGKQGRNNGVLLLWAPVERKVRVEVGVGLEGAIPNAVAAEIVSRVTFLFRRQEYVRGLTVGVDGILERLRLDGPRYDSAASAPETPVGSQPHENLPLIPAIAAAASIGFVLFVRRRWRRGRKRQLSAWVVRDLGRAATALSEAGKLHNSAISALGKLRQEAPAAVWEEFSAVADAGKHFSDLDEQLGSIRSMPQQELGELSCVRGALKRWNAEFAELREQLAAVGARLDSFHYCREHAQLLLSELGESLERRGKEVGGSSAKLVLAARETHTLAESATTENPVNWLLVYDLLLDTQECLQCADNPSQFRRPQRSRSWMSDDMNSPALDLLMMEPAWNSGSVPDNSTSPDSGGFSARDSGGSGDFGGGDSGGGGASSDY